MNEEDNRNEETSADDDLATTPPNPPPPAAPPKWEMPKPVFQQSSGYLPKGFAEQFAPASGKPEPETQALNSESAGETDSVPENVASAPAAAGVEPQPEIFESVPETESIAPAEAPAKKKSSFLRIVLIILGLLTAGFALIAFLVGIWYFFLASNNSRGPF